MSRFKYMVLGSILTLISIYITLPIASKTFQAVSNHICDAEGNYRIDTVVVDTGEAHYLEKYKNWRVPKGYRVLQIKNGKWIAQVKDYTWKSIVCRNPPASVVGCVMFDKSDALLCDYRSEALKLIDDFKKAKDQFEPM